MGRRNRPTKSTEKYLQRKLDREWKTALYARLSDENNGLEDDRSLENQVRYIEDFIRRNPNLKLIDRYVDNGFTGTNFNRPQFTRLMEDVKSGIIDCIVVKDLSRFGRNYIETGYYLEKIFPYLNVRLIAINDNYDSFDPKKRESLTVPIKNLVNEIYTKDIARKVASTFKIREKRGRIIYGLPPYGYLKDKENPFRLVVDTDTEPFVRQMFTWASHGMALAEIARRLNDANVPTPADVLSEKCGATKKKGNRDESRWLQTTVKRILINPTYMGDTFYGGSSGSDGVKEVNGKKINRSNTDRTVWRVIPETHEPLVSREDFEKAQASIEEKAKKRQELKDGRAKQREELPDILNGKFFCFDCGRVMVYSRHFRGLGSQYRDYCCSGYLNDRNGWDLDSENTPKCRKGRFTVDDRLCRTMIFDQIQLQIEAGLQLEKLAASQAKIDTEKRAEIAEAVRLKDLEVKSITAKMQKLYEDYRDKIIDSDDYLSIKQSYTDRQEKAEAELEKLQERLDAAEGKAADKEWNRLKRRLAKISESRTDGDSDIDDPNSNVEIIEDEKPVIPGTGRLTRELLDEMVERVEYGSDGILHIVFKHKDWAAELAEKLMTIQPTESEE